MKHRQTWRQTTIQLCTARREKWKINHTFTKLFIYSNYTFCIVFDYYFCTYRLSIQYTRTAEFQRRCQAETRFGCRLPNAVAKGDGLRGQTNDSEIEIFFCLSYNAIKLLICIVCVPYMRRNAIHILYNVRRWTAYSGHRIKHSSEKLRRPKMAVNSTFPAPSIFHRFYLA